MTTVGARELKIRLGKYLRLVREGTRLIVTDRGRPVAELRPIERSSDDLEARIDELIAVGDISRDEPQPLVSFKPVTQRGPAASDLLLADRDRL